MARKLGVNELGRLSGLSGPTITRLESGSLKVPSQDTAEKLARALRVPYERVDRIIRGLPPDPGPLRHPWSDDPEAEALFKLFEELPPHRQKLIIEMMEQLKGEK